MYCECWYGLYGQISITEHEPTVSDSEKEKISRETDIFMMPTSTLKYCKEVRFPESILRLATDQVSALLSDHVAR